MHALENWHMPSSVIDTPARSAVLFAKKKDVLRGISQHLLLLHHANDQRARRLRSRGAINGADLRTQLITPIVQSLQQADDERFAEDAELQLTARDIPLD
jgi:hypothetical protein